MSQPGHPVNRQISGDYPQVPRQGELGLRDEGAREILRCAQDDKPLAVILSAAKDLDVAFHSPRAARVSQHTL